MRPFFAFLVGLVLGTGPTLAQQLICQQSFGTNMPATLQLDIGLAAVALSPDSVVLDTYLTGSASANAVAGLVSVKRGGCDTTTFARLTNSVQGYYPQLLVTRHRQVQALQSVRNFLYLYRFSRRGQPQVTQGFQAAFGQGYNLQEAPNGDTYLSFAVSGYNYRTALTRIDSLGRVKWQRTYNSSTSRSRDFTLIRPVYTRRGNLLLTGQVEGYNECYVLEVTQQGDSLTARRLFQGFPLRTFYPHAIRALRDGGFLLTSIVDTIGKTYCGFTRLDANLNEQWTTIYRPATGYELVDQEPYLKQGLELADGTLLGACNQLKRGVGGNLRLLRLSAGGQVLNTYDVTSPTSYPFLYATSLTPLAVDSSFVLAGHSGATAIVAQFRLPGLRRVLAEPPVPAAQPLGVRAGTAEVFAAPAYPNPAHELVSVPLRPDAVPATLRLLDALGREVRAQAVPAGAALATVPVAGLPPGLYLLQLARAGQTAATQRLAIGP